jgi:ATP-dependent RNA helicase RhlE
MQFTELGLVPELLRAVSETGYTEPTPIQCEAIPLILQGRDLMGCAQTGTGKTAGFTLPMLQRLLQGKKSAARRGPRALVLAPTRELALQVEESVRTYGKHLPLKSLAMFGGVGMNPQIAALRRGVEVLVACPGRLLDHVNQRTLDLSGVEILVLDEADRMLDMGFIRDIRKILALLPDKNKRQNLLFSATFSDEIRQLAAGFLHDPAYVEVARRNAPADAVRQTIIPLDKDRKKDALLHLFNTRGWNQALIFTRTKHGADALSRTLEKSGIRSAALHGNKTQSARVRALTDFKDGKLSALVATDIAARGIDIDQLPYVINYELPNIAEDYVHRIGRTGRAGAEGEAYSLVCHDERDYLKGIERLMRKTLDRLTLPGFEPVMTLENPAKPNPPHASQNRGAGGGQGRAGRGNTSGATATNNAPRPSGKPGSAQNKRPRSPQTRHH